MVKVFGDRAFEGAMKEYVKLVGSYLDFRGAQ
jgi:hypothetical protein